MSTKPQRYTWLRRVTTDTGLTWEPIFSREFTETDQEALAVAVTQAVVSDLNQFNDGKYPLEDRGGQQTFKLQLEGLDRATIRHSLDGFGLSVIAATKVVYFSIWRDWLS